MSAVYEGEDLRLRGLNVAIKRPLGRDEVALRRFEQEKTILMRLRHEGIVKVRDVGEDYIVLDLIKGQTLGQYQAALEAAGQRVVVRKALEFVGQVGGALGETWRERVVHRDIKPDNIVLVEIGPTVVAKVIDFGASLIKGQPRLTRPGCVVGTASYLSPEHCAGGDIGPEADIYALGVVLFEMLTGEPPFVGPAREVMKRHVNDEPSWNRLRSRYEQDVVELVRRMMNKVPSERPDPAVLVTTIQWLLSMQTRLELPKVPTDDDRTIQASANPRRGSAPTTHELPQPVPDSTTTPTVFLQRPAAARVSEKRRRTSVWAVAGASILGAIIAISAFVAGDRLRRPDVPTPAAPLPSQIVFQPANEHASTSAPLQSSESAVRGVKHPFPNTSSLRSKDRSVQPSKAPSESRLTMPLDDEGLMETMDVPGTKNRLPAEGHTASQGKPKGHAAHRGDDTANGGGKVWEQMQRDPDGPVQPPQFE